jgi:hypothetical protein
MKINRFWKTIAPVQSASLPVLFALLILSCAVRQDVSLRIDGSGTSSLSVELHPVFVKYYADLTSGFSASFDPNNPRIFNIDSIREHFAENPGLELISLAAPEPHRLRMEFRFRDFTETIRSRNPQVANVISMRRQGNRETIRVFLDRKNLASVLQMTPDGNSPLAKMLLPPEGDAISEEEYLDHLAWAMEDYAAGENIETVLRSAAIGLSIRVQGRITAQTGGTLRGDSEVTFQLPLLRLFTLEKPVEYSITYEKR